MALVGLVSGLIMAINPSASRVYWKRRERLLTELFMLVWRQSKLFTLGGNPVRRPRVIKKTSAEEVRQRDLQPKSATALYVGLKSRMMTFSLQRWINTYEKEAVSAVLPGVAFGQLWKILGNVEIALLTISAMVVFTALLGMVISVLGSLNERRREMAILRSVGARPKHVFGLLLVEAVTLVFCGILSGRFCGFRDIILWTRGHRGLDRFVF